MKRKPDDGQGDDDVNAALDLIAKIEPLLAGHHPAVQGAVLMELTATFIRGHHPIEFRRTIFNKHFEHIRQQIENEGTGDADR